jgi:UDP-N-acetylmuramoyl-L-alanyl-D-glutamate--2,6-diaminopimelate ligase
MGQPLSALLKRPLAADPIIEGVTADSRKVGPGYLFAALPGVKADGRSFAAGAVEKGAVAVLAGEAIEGLGAPVILSADVRRAYALAAAAFYGAQPKTCVAVTGTNGKTSVAVFCRQIFMALGQSAASLGTLGLTANDEALTGPGLTTPDAGEMARILADLARRGVTHLALEASSHGIDQRRLDGVKLTAAGFTNLSQDHLDYHGSMEAYGQAKLRLFTDLLPRGGTAVLNADSPAYAMFAAACAVNGHTMISVGQAGRDIRLARREATPEGQALALELDGQRYDVRLPLAGAFQADNALVAAGLCVATGLAPAKVIAALETLQGAPGRLQHVGAAPRGGDAYVDYAHTPDGLETVLKSLRPHARGRLIVVFGAGGDRDKGKRPLMGKAALTLADAVIVTDDNPRSEDPASIRAAILAAAPGAREIGDRRAAIAAGAAMLGPGDVLVVAGKGHERGQTVGDTVHPFDDVEETAKALGLAQ